MRALRVKFTLLRVKLGPVQALDAAGMRMRVLRVKLGPVQDLDAAGMRMRVKFTLKFSDEKMPVTSAAVEAILDYTYLGQMKLNPENAVEVLRVIDFFSMVNIMQTCADFVVAHAMTLDNVFALRSFFIAARLNGQEGGANNFIKVCAILSERFSFHPICGVPRRFAVADPPTSEPVDGRTRGERTQ